MTQFFSLTTKALPQRGKPFRIAEFPARRIEGVGIGVDIQSAQGIAQRFNTLHVAATDVYGVVISIHEDILPSDNAGHFRELEALPDGLYAHVTWRDGFADVLQGDTVTSEFSVTEGVVNLESVEISRP
jgi:hypothetical protein